METILNLNLTDCIIIGVIVVSTLISLLRGFIKEFISLFVWILGLWVAIKFYHVFAVMLSPYVTSVAVGQILSFIGIFVLVLIFGILFNFVFSFVIVKTGLTGTDRTLGMLFGGIRGFLLVGVVLLLISSTAFVQDAWWKHSTLIPHLQFLVDWLQVFLPEKMTGIASSV